MEFSFGGTSLQQRREKLAEVVKTNGSEWANLRARGADFMAVVERIDRQIIADEEFLNSAFENSPLHMLRIGYTDNYNPLFGYYEPSRARVFVKRMQAIPATVVAGWENGKLGDLTAQVLRAFQSTFAEAANRDHAVAIEHR